MIVAASDADVIGHEGALPWRLSADLQRFKAITLGKPVIMGRRTWTSIGRPLPGRVNIVVTRSAAFVASGAIVVHDFAAALAAADPSKPAPQEIMVIGGAEIYALALPQVQRIHLTRVHGEVRGDTRMIALDPAAWREVSREELPADERNSHATSYIVLDRRAGNFASMS